MTWLISTVLGYVFQASIIVGLLWYAGFIKLNLRKNKDTLSEEQLYNQAIKKLKFKEEDNKSEIRQMILNGFKKLSNGRSSVKIFYNVWTWVSSYDDKLVEQVLTEFRGNNYFVVEEKTYSNNELQKYIIIRLRYDS